MNRPRPPPTRKPTPGAGRARARARAGKENTSANPPAAAPPARRALPAPSLSNLRSLLNAMAVHATAGPEKRADVLSDRDGVLSGAIAAAATHASAAALAPAMLLLARLSLDARTSARFCRPPYCNALQAALALQMRSTLSREAWRDAARVVRNAIALSASNATVLARDTDLVRLIVARLADAVAARPGEEAVECAGALANFARHGLQFQAYVRKHGGLAALCAAAQQTHEPTCCFHACRALAEFSLDHKWLMGLVAEGCIAIMLAIVDSAEDMGVLSEATRFLGNVATSRIGRDAVNSAKGIDRLVFRVLMIVHECRQSTRMAVLTIDLLRTTSNLCVDCKPAAHRLIHRGGVMAFIEAYGDADNRAPPQDIDSNGSDAGMQKSTPDVRTEAFRGLLIVAQGGQSCRASVLREIGIRIRQDGVKGRCTAHLYDLGRRIKVEASTERKDDIPQTIAGLGALSKEYLFQAGPLAKHTERNGRPDSVPDMKSPAAAGFRQSGRVLSVQRPAPYKERQERQRRERPPHLPSSPARQNVDGRAAKRSPRRPRTAGSPAGGRGLASSPKLDSDRSGHRARSAEGSKFANRFHSDPLHDLADIPHCKVIQPGKAKHKSTDGNWAMAVWGAVCNAVTRPPNSPRPRSVERDTFGSICPELEAGEDVFEMGVVLGRGGFATVYLAKNLRTGELVAMKRFHPIATCTPDARKKSELALRQALREQRIWDGLAHKNIVSYRGCFIGEEGELNLVAEYIPGLSLGEHLAQYHHFPEHLVASITLQIIDGLNYLHKCGVTHRDLKPANVLVDSKGAIKITDFGVSSSIDIATMTGQTFCGTPWYIAPEMIRGETYGKSIDVWSLGCTVLELATGKRPYHDKQGMVAMNLMTKHRMPPIPKRLSPLLQDFLKTCWVWDPLQRPTPANLRRHPFLAPAVRAEVMDAQSIASSD